MRKPVLTAPNMLKRETLIKIVSLSLAILLVLIFVTSKLRFGVKKQALPQYDKMGLSEAIDTIDNEAGEVLVAETNATRLYVDTETLNIIVEDIQTGIRWDGISTDEGADSKDKSPIIIKYTGKDGTAHERNAYDSSIKHGHYQINQIEDGAQVVFDFSETGGYRLGEYIPEKISIERYEELFLDALEQKEQEGVITSTELGKYKSALNMTYGIDTDENCYYQKISGAPPTSLVNTLIEITEVVDYTTEMLFEDSQEFGIMVEVTEPARFIVTAEFTLEDDDLVVRVPTYEVDNKTEEFELQNITLLPTFGYALADEIEDGYIFAPDGSGALFKLNTFNSKYPEYTRPVYDNTYYDKLYEMPDFPEDVHMPVFGMYYDGESISKGFMGIIEEGAELGHIRVQLGTTDTATGGTPYNKVHSTFDVSQNSRVKVFGPYSDNDARYPATTGPIDVDYTVRYKLFPEKISYYDMATSYRDYLIAKYDLDLDYDPTPKLFLDVIGTLTIEERILGIPHKKLISMTEYSELLDIVNDMDGINKVINYRGFFNGGLVNTAANKVSAVKLNGKSDELDKLKSQLDENGDELFYTADLMRISKKGSGFKPKSHALYGYDSEPLRIRPYDYSTGRFRRNSSSHYLINPLYLSGIVDKFMDGAQEYENVFLTDMGSTYYANYNNSEIVNPIHASGILKDGLEKIKQEKEVALDNPNIDKVRFSKYATNISRESSDYATMYTSIPFRQLVMNGITEYTTLDINTSYERDDYYILQALELGSIPKYTISAKSTDLLKDSVYTDYFSIQYKGYKDRIKSLYDKCAEGLEQIGTREIVNHEMLEENVFKTTYASGTSIIVNYNKYDVTVKGVGQLEALDYKIVSGTSNVAGGAQG